jgi:hypothetical protein
LSTAIGVLRAQELDRIYLRANSANARAVITDLILFHEGFFLQGLEGAAAGIASLLEKIRRDRKHTNLIVPESGAVDARCFAQSPMHFIAARNLAAGKKQAFSELRQAVAGRPGAPLGGHGLSDFLAAFAAAKPV